MSCERRRRSHFTANVPVETSRLGSTLPVLPVDPALVLPHPCRGPSKRRAALSTWRRRRFFSFHQRTSPFSSSGDILSACAFNHGVQSSLLTTSPRSRRPLFRGAEAALPVPGCRPTVTNGYMQWQRERFAPLSDIDATEALVLTILFTAFLTASKFHV